MKKTLTGILLAVMMLFAICAGTAAMAGAADPISFTTTTLTGETFDSSIFQDYDLVMINLWAEWCGPCMGELPDLEQIHQEYPNVLLLGAYCGSDSNAALQAAQQKGVTYPLIQKPRVINNYIEINGSGSYSIPQTCFFDRNGNALGSAYVGSRSYSNWKTIVDEKLAGDSGSGNSEQTLSFTTTTLTGETFDSSSFQNYDLVMINLWAEWCGPCMRELPDLEQIHQEYPNVLLLGGYCDYDGDAALQAAQQKGVTYPLIWTPYDIYAYIEIENGSFGIPQTCFFDRNGNALGSAYIGGRNYDDWKAIVDEKLAEVGSEKPVPVPEPGENLPGDVNEDGVVDGRDVVRLMKYLAGEEEDEETGEPLEINYDSADVDGSGAIDEKDLLRLIRYLGGENVKLLPGAMSGNG